jgi:hypothetical protein
VARLAASDVDVTIDIIVIGQVTTDHNGRGRLELSAAALSTVHAGSTIVIGDLTNPLVQGTFA